MRTMLRLLLCAVLAVASSSCTLLASRGARVDSRTDFPGAKPFDASTDELPGREPAAASDLRGAWYFRETLQDVPMEHGREPWLFHATWIWLREDGTYDLVYQAYWGSRARNAPGSSGVDVRESGRFSLAAGALSIEPDVTRAIEVRPGSRQTRTLANEPREYLAAVDGGYLHLAGRCASYQVEPICRLSRDVLTSLRSVSARSPDDVPEL